MFYNNYRFHLSDDLQCSDPEHTSEQIKQILSGASDLELIRVAIDLSGQNKSVSLLCQLEENPDLQSKVTALLLEAGFTIKRMEKERLTDEDERDHEHHHGHGHGHHHGHSHEPHHGHNHAHHDEQNHEPHHGHNHAHHDEQNHEPHHGHSHAHHDEQNHEPHHGHSHDNHWLKAALGLAWGIGLLALSLSGFAIPIIAYYVLTGLTTLMTLYLGRTVYQSAWRALRELRWDITSLYAISTLTIVAVSLLSLFIPGLPMMFEAAPLVLGFWHLGEGIEHTLVDSINKKLDVRDCVPPLVLLKGNPDKAISIKTLIPNDTIIVTKGCVIPVDGILTTSAQLYTTRVDGSPHLKMFQPGDEVKAGMCLVDFNGCVPALEMRVTKTYQNSYLSLIAKNIKKANDEKAPIELFANKVLTYFIPGLLAVALLSGLVIGFFFTPALAIQCVISVLVSACPCALSLITPMAVKIGMKKAAEQGIHFNNGKALQAAADINAVVFDLNGTLTKGEIAVNTLHISDRSFLSHVALLEAQSGHAVAKAIKSYIQKEDIIPSEELVVQDFDDTHHSGVKGMINGELFMIGNQKMLFNNGITQIKAPYENPENGSIYIVRGTTVIGQIDLVTDPLRVDAIATIKQLQRQGKAVHICTGDNQASAEKYAALLGIPKSNICAHAVGVETASDQNSKTNYIKKLQAMGYKVAMIGDAANDLTAIANADIGIAVKSTIGDEVTQQHAGIVILQGLLFPIATAFDVAEKTQKNIFQNLLVSLTYNSTITLVAAGLFIALGFVLNPAIGVALMVLESTIVLANLYRFKHQEVVTPESNNVNEVLDEMDSETTTSRILNALGCYSRPQQEPMSRHNLETRTSKAGAFFASSTPVSVLTEGPVNGILPQ